MIPTEFADYTRRLMGNELYSILEQGLEEKPPVSVRLNPFKTDGRLECGEQVPWCKLGYWLQDHMAFTFDPMLHAGLYYVQEASSMFIIEAISQCVKRGILPNRPLTAIDLCAAPGGKSTALRSILPKGSLLFCNEPIKTRASVLKENMMKFGHPDIIVTNNFPHDYQKAGIEFDLVVADVPCSGEGMFRKDEGAVNEWSMQNVDKCWQLQRAIIKDIWPCLKPGGTLIYSTCTYNAHENEENVKWIADALGATPLRIDTYEKWHIIGPLLGDVPCCRFIPGRTRGEGLFMAALKKEGEENVEKAKTLNNVKKKANKKSNEFDNWLIGDFDLKEYKEAVRAIPATWSDVYDKASKRLHVIHAGVELGIRKGKGIVPATSLALSIALNRATFPQSELGLADAISYLRKEAVTLRPDAPRGFTIVTYRHQPLGFVKNIGQRANNLYPQEWKIKSSHIPGSVSSLPCHPIEQ